LRAMGSSRAVVGWGAGSGGSTSRGIALPRGFDRGIALPREASVWGWSGFRDSNPLLLPDACTA